MDLIPILRQVPLFQDLQDDHLALVASLASEHRVPAGTSVSRQADLGETMFLIAEGEAVVRRVDDQGMQRPVGMLTAPAAFGVTALLVSAPRDATVTAVSPVRLYTIRRADLDLLLDGHPEIRRRLCIPDEISALLRAPVFPWLKEGETVLSWAHRHGLSLFRSLLSPTFLLIAYGALIAYVLPRLGVSLSRPIWLGIGALVYAIAFLWHWVDWRNDYFVVTSRRVTHQERVALLYESREETPLDRVQNVNIKRGVLGAIFKYGDIAIETASRVGHVGFTDMPHPEGVRDVIFEHLARVRAARKAAERNIIRDELVERITDEHAEMPPATLPGEKSMIGDRTPTTRPGVHSGPLVRLLDWLAAQGFVPRTRLQTEQGIVWRKHWVFMVRDAVLPALLGLTCAVLTVLGVAQRPAALYLMWPEYPYLSGALLVIMTVWLWWQVNDWANDLYIIADDRIIDIEKRPLFFSEERREASLGMIQNVSLEIPHIWASLLNYGDVIVTTAGAGEFTFHKVANPRLVQQEIFAHMEAYRERQRDQETARRRDELAEWLTVYDELRSEKAEPGGPRTDTHLADSD